MKDKIDGHRAGDRQFVCYGVLVGVGVWLGVGVEAGVSVAPDSVGVTISVPAVDTEVPVVSAARC